MPDTENPLVYLRDVGHEASDGEWEECWVPCSKGDVGAVEFAPTDNQPDTPAPDAVEQRFDARTFNVLVQGLHATVFGVHSLQDPEHSHKALSDDGEIHEAIHALVRALSPTAALTTQPSPALVEAASKLTACHVCHVRWEGRGARDAARRHSIKTGHVVYSETTYTWSYGNDR